MQQSKWGYDLIITASESQGNKVRQHEQLHHFGHFNEAFTQLLELDLTRFSTEAPKEPGQLIYDRVELRNNNVGGAASYLTEISKEAASKENQIPGIYLVSNSINYPEYSVDRTPEILSFFIGSQSHPHLPLGYFRDPDSNKIVKNPMVPGIIDELKKIIPEKAISRYKLQIHYHQFEKAATTQHNYHYNNLADAFSELLKIDITHTDQRIAKENGNTAYISYAGVCDSSGLEIANIRHGFVKAEEGRNMTVFIQMKVLPRDISQQTGIDLSVLPGYRTDNKLLLASYNTDHNAILPEGGYLQLLKSIEHSENQRQRFGPQEFTVKFTFLPKTSQDKEILAGESLQFQYESFAAAFKRVYKIDSKSFTANRFEEVTILDRDNRPMLTKLMDPGTGKLPAGMYVKMDPDCLNQEVIKTISPYLSAIPHLGSFNLLICNEKMKERQVEARFAGNRRYGDTGSDMSIKH